VRVGGWGVLGVRGAIGRHLTQIACSLRVLPVHTRFSVRVPPESGKLVDLRMGIFMWRGRVWVWQETCWATLSEAVQ